MVLPKIVRVAVEQTAFHFDKLYSYTFPDFLGEPVAGCRVMVPFGGGNRRRQGIIMDVGETAAVDRLKPVLALLDKTPLLNDEMLLLARWIKDRTFCACFDAARAMLPTGLYLNIRRMYKSAVLSDNLRDSLNEDELAAWKLALKPEFGITSEALCKKTGMSADSDFAQRLVRKGVLVCSDNAFSRVGDATVRMARISSAFEDRQEDDVIKSQRCTPKQSAIIRLLFSVGNASVKEICYFCGVTPAVVTALVNKGIINCYDHEVSRISRAETEATVPPAELGKEQQAAYDRLLELYSMDEAAASLLYGITGSGKTQVYMNLIDHVIQNGRQVIVLVPEISLTPQLLSLFTARFGGKIAMLHSGLAIGERADEWKRIRNGEAPIVIGTRSAVFAPLERIGLIIMDEEQEHTYKSERSPRYHARDVAKWRCNHHNALLLLCSATPSIETFHAAQTGRFAMQRLIERFGEAELPQVEIVDMRIQPDEGISTLISGRLKDEIIQTLEHGHQVILLLNRRGYNTFVSCRSCGHVITCPQCSISMTYHRANDRLMCHYCGYSRIPLNQCPECGSQKVRYSGLGTQKAEIELVEMFPEARVLRMDTDTTMARGAYENKFGEFASGKYNLMIGTQMVAKGLDFPGVRLVGVLSADQSLYGDDYRCFESTFSLLTQVVGRAGRRDGGGKAVIQTYTPDNYVIELASEQDYEGFYATEIEARRMLKYPPYTDIFMFGFVSGSEDAAKHAAHSFLSMLRHAVTDEYSDVPVIVLDPSPAAVSRVAGKYRYKLIVKTRNTARMREMAGGLITEFSRIPANKGVTVFADINPANM